MRLPTKKLTRGYLHKFYRLDVEKKDVSIVELKPFADGYNLCFRTDTENCISINRETEKITFHGKAKKLLQAAETISGFTFGLEDIIRPFGFRYTYIDGVWKKRAAVATQQ